MYEIMFYTGLVLFVIGFIVTAVLFVKNHVAKTIGDFTGYNAKKAVKKLQEERAEKMQNVEPVKFDVPRSKKLQKTKKRKVKEDVDIEGFFETEEDITVFGGEVVTQMPKTVLDEEDDMDKDDEVTDLLYDDSEEQTDILGEDVATEVLAEEEMTDVLTDKEMTDDLADKEMTEVLVEDEMTSVLADEANTEILPEEKKP